MPWAFRRSAREHGRVVARTGDYYSRENDDDYLEPEWFGGDLLKRK